MSLHNVTTRLSLGAFTLAIIVSISCSKRASPATAAPRPTKPELLALWQAPATPIGQRESAADGLLSTNMLVDEIEKLLGPPTRRGHEHPRLAPDAPAQVPAPGERSYYDYQFKDGTIVVGFVQVTNMGRFEATSVGVGIALDAGEPESTDR